ncbi:hypothetical protein HNQ60_000096 [Povalibacter uvarum]|uniref:Beta-barrel porin 2 n=1 Tax=Povalibacter uvarum TaxID=732238 RepID=A0A841HFW9_9GAMM|nr:hypothetical protein [Povalibacter uvarum]MBB6091250.1 hypothetical protein [Povalibacter uvarum]
MNTGLRSHVAVACAGLLAGGGAHAAEWLIKPDAHVAADYTDNPRMLFENSGSDSGAVAELRADIVRRTDRTTFSVQPRLRSSRYQTEESLNSDDQYLVARFAHTAERSRWDASLNLTHDSTLTSEIGSTGIVQANRRHEGVSASAGPTWIMSERVQTGAQLYWLGNHYVDADFTGLVDYTYSAMSLFSRFSMTERSSLTVTAQGSVLDVDHQTESTRDVSLRTAWNYQIDSLWSTELSAGPALVRNVYGDDVGGVFSVDISRRDETWNVFTRVGRDLTPTGRGVLTRRDQISFGTDRRLTERFKTGLTASWIRNQDLLPQPGTAFSEVTYGRLDLRADWRLAQSWSVALSLSGSTQEYDTRSGRAESYRALLSLVWNGQAQNP